jgi:hypothetical protein
VREVEMATYGSKGGFRRNWKKLLGIYLVVAAVAYFLIFLAIQAGNGGGGGGLYG